MTRFNAGTMFDAQQNQLRAQRAQEAQTRATAAQTYEGAQQEKSRTNIEARNTLRTQGVEPEEDPATGLVRPATDAAGKIQFRAGGSPEDKQLATDTELHAAGANAMGQNVYEAARNIRNTVQDFTGQSAALADLTKEHQDFDKDNPAINATEGMPLWARLAGGAGPGIHPTKTAQDLQQKKADLKSQIDDLTKKGYSTIPEGTTDIQGILKSLTPDTEVGNRYTSAKDAHAAAVEERKAWDAVAPKKGGDIDQIIRERTSDVLAAGNDPAKDSVLTAIESRKAELGIKPLTPEEQALRDDPVYGPAVAKARAAVANGQAQVAPLQALADKRMSRIESVLGLDSNLTEPGGDLDARLGLLSTRISQMTDPAQKGRAQTLLNALEPTLAQLRQSKSALQPALNAHDALQSEWKKKYDPADAETVKASNAANALNAPAWADAVKAERNNPANRLVNPVTGEPFGGDTSASGPAPDQPPPSGPTGPASTMPQQPAGPEGQQPTEPITPSDHTQEMPSAVDLKTGKVVYPSEMKPGVVESMFSNFLQKSMGSLGTIIQGAAGLAVQHPNLPEDSASAKDKMDWLKKSPDPILQWARQAPEKSKQLFPVSPEQSEKFAVKAAGEAGGFAAPALSGPLAPFTMAMQSAGEHINNDYDELVKKGMSPRAASEETFKRATASGLTSEVIWSVLPTPLRKLGDKFLIDKFGVAGVKRFLLGRAAALGEGAVLGASTRIGENTTSGEDMFKGVGESAGGMAGLQLLFPRGKTSLEGQRRANPAGASLPPASEQSPLVTTKPTPESAALGAVDTTQHPDRVAAIDERIKKGGTPKAMSALQTQRDKLTSEAGRSQGIHAASQEIEGLQPSEQVAPEQVGPTQNALRGLAKISQGQPLAALTAAERVAVLAKGPDGNARVELVRGPDGKQKPVIVDAALERARAVAPTTAKILPASEHEQRQAILNPPVEETAPKSGSVEAPVIEPQPKPAPVQPPTSKPPEAPSSAPTAPETKRAGLLSKVLQRNGVDEETATAFANKFVGDRSASALASDQRDAVKSEFTAAGGKFTETGQREPEADAANQTVLAKLKTPVAETAAPAYEKAGGQEKAATEPGGETTAGETPGVGPAGGKRESASAGEGAQTAEQAAAKPELAGRTHVDESIDQAFEDRKSDFKRAGISKITESDEPFGAFGVRDRPDGSRELLVNRKIARDWFDKKGPEAARELIQKGLEEESQHATERKVARDNGTDTAALYRDWAKKNPDQEKILSDAYGKGWAKYSDDEKSAELSRMILQTRATGKTTEQTHIGPERSAAVDRALKEFKEPVRLTDRLRQHLSNVLEYLRGIKNPSKAILDHIKEVERFEGELKTSHGREFSTRPPFDKFGSEATPTAASVINDHGGIISKSQAKKTGRYEGKSDLWDDAPAMKHPTHNKIYSPNGVMPDEAAQGLHDAGLIKEPSVGAMWDALGKESQTARSIATSEMAQGAEATATAKQTTDFTKAAGDTSHPEVAAKELQVGDTVKVGSEPMKVTDIDPDNFDVTLEDGKKFGIQTVKDDQVIYGEHATTEQPTSKNIPTLRPGEKQGDLLSKQTEDLTLAGEKGTDFAKRAEDQAAREKASEEAKTIQDKQQGQFESPPAEPKPAEVAAPRKVEDVANTTGNDLHKLLTFPEGSTSIRVTDDKGRQTVLPIKSLNGMNPLQGAGPWKKIEAGTIISAAGKRGQFSPIKGEVRIKMSAENVATLRMANPRARIAETPQEENELRVLDRIASHRDLRPDEIQQARTITRKFASAKKPEGGWLKPEHAAAEMEATKAAIEANLSSPELRAAVEAAYKNESEPLPKGKYWEVRDKSGEPIERFTDFETADTYMRADAMQGEKLLAREKGKPDAQVPYGISAEPSFRDQIGEKPGLYGRPPEESAAIEAEATKLSGEHPEAAQDLARDLYQRDFDSLNPDHRAQVEYLLWVEGTESRLNESAGKYHGEPDDSELKAGELLQKHLPLADVIARGYSNVPGVDAADVQQHARIALARAAKAFDPARGTDFAALAKRAIRNELNGLYRGQSKKAVEQTTLDAPLPEGAGQKQEVTAKDQIADTGKTPADQVAYDEGIKILHEAIDALPAKMRTVMSRLAAGDAPGDIARDLGIVKQGVSNLKLAALRRLRGKLGEQGITGIDDAGILQMANPAKEFYDEDLKPGFTTAGKAFVDTIKRITNVLAPRIGVEAGTVDALGEMQGERNRAAYQLERLTKPLDNMLSKLGPQGNVDFVDRIKRGEPQPSPELDALSKLYRTWEDDRMTGVREFKPSAAYIENHYRVLWKTIPGSDEARVGIANSFKKLSKPDQSVFDANFKAGRSQTTPEMQRIADQMKATGIDPTWAPRKDGSDEFKNLFGLGRRPLEGDKSFLKRHTLDDMSQGLLLGGKPASDNANVMFRMNDANVRKYISAQRMWGALKDIGVRQFVKPGQDRPAGWTKIDDRIASTWFPSDKGMVHAGDWYVEPGAARLLNNHLSHDYIRESAAGRGLVYIKNATTAAELAFSPFHAIFEGGESVASSFGLGVSKIVNRGLFRADPKAFVDGLRDIVTSPVAPYTVSRIGGAAVRSMDEGFWKSDEGKWLTDKFPGQDVKQMIMDGFNGGLKPSMHEDYKINAVRSFLDSWNRDNYLGAALRTMPAINEAITNPLFDKFIPRLKWGQFLKEYSNELAIHADDLASGKMSRTTLARQVSDFVEDRFGELNFDNLYWNRTFKTATQLLFRSVTWKLGSLRAAVGALPEQGAEFIRAAQEHRAPVLNRKVAWLMGLAVATTAMSSVIQGVFAKKKLETMRDVLHPRVDPNDDTIRVTSPTYAKEVYHMVTGPVHYLESSTSGMAGHMLELANNRDFYGVKIHNEDDGWKKQAVDMGKYGAGMLVPFSIRGYKRMSDQEMSISRKLLAWSGFNPAPQSVSDTPAQALTRKFMDQKMEAKGARTSVEADKSRLDSKLEKTARGGDTLPVRQAILDGKITRTQAQNILAKARLTPFQAKVHSLSLEHGLRVFEKATDSEKTELRPILQKKNDDAHKRGELTAIEYFDNKTKLAGETVPQAARPVLHSKPVMPRPQPDLTAGRKKVSGVNLIKQWKQAA
jgi:RNA polymerase sigma factor (sigma-70 family)